MAFLWAQYRDEVIAINYLLKSRAKRFIAAANKDWLYPERHFSGSKFARGRISTAYLKSLWRTGEASGITSRPSTFSGIYVSRGTWNPPMRKPGGRSPSCSSSPSKVAS